MDSDRDAGIAQTMVVDIQVNTTNIKATNKLK